MLLSSPIFVFLLTLIFFMNQKPLTRASGVTFTNAYVLIFFSFFVIYFMFLNDFVDLLFQISFFLNFISITF